MLRHHRPREDLTPRSAMKSNPFSLLVKMTAAAFLVAACSTRAMGNTAPLISDVPDQVIAQNTSTATNYFIVGDAESGFNLTVTAISGNTVLVPLANLTLGGSLSQRTIRVTPTAGQTGSAVITLSASDGTFISSSTFTVTVTAANTPPTLTGLAEYQIVAPGLMPAAMPFTVGDAETAVGSLVVTSSSSNVGLVPNANITLGGSGANRTVRVTPVAGQRGTAVIKVKVTDALGAFTPAEFIFSVFDAASANNAIPQPHGIYALDSGAGTIINGVSMRDASVRDVPFVDGYVLRTDWATLEPSNGVFSFTIIDNIFTKLPANQKLSLIVFGSPAPWLIALPGVTTWTAGSPSVTAPLPWDAITQERFRLLMVALGSHLVNGTPLRDHPRFAAVHGMPPGLKNGIREPDEIHIRDMPGYTRPLFQNAMLHHLRNVVANFTAPPVHIGFWTYTDNQDASYGGVTPWEQLRQAILAEFNGLVRKRIGFWEENLAASRSAAQADPWIGHPTTGFTAPLYLSQDSGYVGYQVLGPWSRPFSAGTVDNILNGSPEDGMDYGFNSFHGRYYEHYGADIDFAGYTAEFQRWHDFLAALPDGFTPLERWIAARFTAADQANPLISGLSADPDGDGVKNLLEYTFNLDPKKPDGTNLLSPSIAHDLLDGKDYLTITYTRRKPPRDITYHLEASDALTVWNEGAAFTQEMLVTDDGNGLTDTVTARALAPIAPGARQFLRLRVTQP